MTPRSSYLSSVYRFSQVGSLLAAFGGAAVLMGWLFDSTILKSVLPGLASMKVNTALAFLAAGVALWSLHTSVPASRGLARALSLTAAALGGLTLSEDLFAIELGIDQLMLRDAPQAAMASHPGRMAPMTALNFLLIGLALLALKARPSRFPIAWTYWLAFPPLIASSVAIVGYAYGVRSLYKVGPYAPMALHTALYFFVLSLSLLAAEPTRGIGRVALSDTAGGVVARRLLPTIPAIFFGLGWARLAGQEAGLYDTRFGLALMVVLCSCVSVLAVASTAVALHAVDVKRKEAEAEILSLNAGLEQRVRERTQELQDSMAQVEKLHDLLPICAWCKKIRGDRDYWQTLEHYIAAGTGARFTHGICPDCRTKILSPDTARA